MVVDLSLFCIWCNKNLTILKMWLLYTNSELKDILQDNIDFDIKVSNIYLLVSIYANMTSLYKK